MSKSILTRRTIIIGDVHGCADELAKLVEACGYKKGQDRLLQTGDLINRGPKSFEAWVLAKELGMESVLGNHELHLVRFEAGQPVYKKWIQGIKDQFGKHYPAYLADIRQWPLWIEEEDFLLVHAGLVPGKSLGETDPKQLTSIRTWDGMGSDLDNENNPPWFDFYHQEKLVVFGHWAKLEGVVRPNVIGLDSGCVYGKKLTALILPERELVSVPAARVYRDIVNPDPDPTTENNSLN
ncbi:MAG: hypothetical protein A2527_09400 [Candidatus Lambdaproteobacteria bacterium RIFOXYD2_FULL_50_16]|uniref:Calcineurin-like phosphoesterase domain-containing protein n=1 Tax=Candidatus Lambdaproteobacteria bacterium RIFOXYD2_FULL_50_16 TaxID=1817772 RepID=A0A1F6G7H5_9PROT|nr:MAG: hypothetical protein A2527_09400 [Candidatus Lambdaproteobacteria bacterium RIFOXYD2_FULL_50_16]